MKAIRCRDVGVNCDFECRGATVEEVMAKVAKHALTAHGMKEIPKEKVAQVRAAIHDV